MDRRAQRVTGSAHAPFVPVGRRARRRTILCSPAQLLAVAGGRAGMNGPMLSLRLLAVSDSLRNFEFDWPATPGRWAIAIAAIVALVAVAIGVYRLDSRGLNRGWRVLLTALRLAVIALLVVIAVNPQERIRQMAFRPSGVAILG